MGTDIHMYVEARETPDGPWVLQPMPAPSPQDEEWHDGYRGYDIRNYKLFAVLAGVRYSEPPPAFPVRGIPQDLSEGLRCDLDLMLDHHFITKEEYERRQPVVCPTCGGDGWNALHVWLRPLRSQGTCPPRPPGMNPFVAQALENDALAWHIANPTPWELQPHHETVLIESGWEDQLKNPQCPVCRARGWVDLVTQKALEREPWLGDHSFNWITAAELKGYNWEAMPPVDTFHDWLKTHVYPLSDRFGDDNVRIVFGFDS